MAGLPHFTSSKISMRNWEPVYQNLFEVSLVLPSSLRSRGSSLLIESIKKIGGLEVDKYPALVEQMFKNATRSFLGGKPESTTVDLTIDFEVNIDDNNSMFVYKTLREWWNLGYDPLTGASGRKVDYLGGPLVVSVHDKVGQITRQYTFPAIMPGGPLPALELDYASDEIWTISVPFRADYWSDAIV